MKDHTPKDAVTLTTPDLITRIRSIINMFVCHGFIPELTIPPDPNKDIDFLVNELIHRFERSMAPASYPPTVNGYVRESEPIELNINVCVGCSHLSIDPISPTALTCCPERKMVPLREFLDMYFVPKKHDDRFPLKEPDMTELHQKLDEFMSKVNRGELQIEPTVSRETSAREQARMNLWISVAASVGGSFGAREPEAMTRWADKALEQFDKRFPK